MRHLYLALALFSIVAMAMAQDKEKPLTADELEKALQKKNVFFLDVRQPKELEELGTIDGYTNIPVEQLESRLSEIPKDKLIITA
jgi:rhodanese-related sulfurtransferase